MELLKDLRVKVFGYTDEEILKAMSNLEVDENAVREYKMCINKNRHLDRRTLEIKLRRNVLISKDIKLDKVGNEKIVHYGNLTIVLLGNKIVKVMNSYGEQRKFKIDKRLKERINKLYLV